MNTLFEIKMDTLVSNGYDFNMSSYIDIAWQNFKKEPGLYIGYLLIYGIIMILLSLIPYASYIITTILAPLLVIGFAIAARNIQNSKMIDLSTFFDGFNTNPGQLILVAIVSSVLLYAAFLPLIAISYFVFGTLSFFDDFTQFPDLENVSTGIGILMLIAFLIAFAVATYLAVAWSWATYFVAFKNYGAWEAMETSRKIIHKNWWLFFGFYFLLGLINLLGALPCLLGLLITVPFMYIASFMAFQKITGLDDFDEIETIGLGIEHDDQDTSNF